MKFSIFENITVTEPFGEAGITDLIEVMGSEQLKVKTEYVRNSPNDEIMKKRKRFLPYITGNGVFSKRDNDGLLKYNQMTVVDFDHVPTEKMGRLKDYLCSHPLTHFLFVSPSGNGIKIFIRHNNANPSIHVNLYPQIYQYYHDTLGIPYTDNNVKDLSRTTYLCYDTDTYYNPNSEVFHFDFERIDKVEVVKNVRERSFRAKQDEPMTMEMVRKNNFYQMTWKDKALMDYIDKYQWQHFPEDYEVGHRNDSLIKKATQLCRCGVDYDLALWKLGFLYSRAGVSEGDIEERVSYAYMNNGADFGIDRYEWQKKRNEGVQRYKSKAYPQF